MKRVAAAGIVPSRVLTQSDPSWPPEFGELSNVPEQIEIAGELTQSVDRVALVGTRHPTPAASQLAFALGRELAAAGWVVVSGGAQGIDSEAHRGALAAGGCTWAVLGTPLERPYPSANLPLFQQILKRGALLSEVSAQAAMYPARFLARNRLIAALARVVVVIQAPRVSGALSTAAEARRLKRHLLAVPYAPWEKRGEGCLDLLAKGAAVCRDSRDVLSLAAASPTQGICKTRPKNLRRPDKDKDIQGLDADEVAVCRALQASTLSADELCEASGLTAPRVQRAVLMLLLSKVIQEVGSGRYTRCDYR